MVQPASPRTIKRQEVVLKKNMHLLTIVLHKKSENMLGTNGSGALGDMQSQFFCVSLYRCPKTCSKHSSSYELSYILELKFADSCLMRASDSTQNTEPMIRHNLFFSLTLLMMTDTRWKCVKWEFKIDSISTEFATNHHSIGFTKWKNAVKHVYLFVIIVWIHCNNRITIIILNWI